MARKKKQPEPPKEDLPAITYRGQDIARLPQELLDIAPFVIPIDSAKQHPRNYRQGDVPAIRRSLEIHGQYSPIVLQKSTGFIVKGNHTHQAACAEGWGFIWAMPLDMSDEQALEILVADNAASDKATNDNVALAMVLAQIESAGRLEAALYTKDELDAITSLMRNQNKGKRPKDDPGAQDIEPEGSKKIRPLPGDVWELGQHLLICGDCRDPLVFANVPSAGPRHCQIMVTDPPYGVDYVGKTEEELTINDDTIVGLVELLDGGFKMANAVLEHLAPIYVFHPSANDEIFKKAFKDRPWHYHQTLIWVKNSLVMGRLDYHYQHEPILYGWKEAKKGVGGSHPWVGDRKQSTCLNFDRPSASRDHPTMKPVDLIKYLLGNSAKAGDWCLDIFGGSGSTLMACDDLGMQGLLVEKDPRYAESILRRWELAWEKEAALLYRLAPGE